MQILSTNVGQPEAYSWQGRQIQTSMNKKPQASPLIVRFDKIEGDVFRDKVHGGRESVVYAMGKDVFPLWKTQFDLNVGAGNFGENLTVDDLHESQIFLNDHFKVGSTVLCATSARIPCYKLNARFGRADVQTQFVSVRRPGVYFQVIQEGQIQVGDTFELVKRHQQEFSILDYYDIYCELSFAKTCTDVVRLRAFLDSPALNPVFKPKFEKLFSVAAK